MICSARTSSSSRILVPLSPSSGMLEMVLPAEAMAGSLGGVDGLSSLPSKPAKSSALPLVVEVAPTSVKRTALSGEAISCSWTPETSEKLELCEPLQLGSLRDRRSGEPVRPSGPWSSASALGTAPSCLETDVDGVTPTLGVLGIAGVGDASFVNFLSSQSLFLGLFLGLKTRSLSLRF